MKNKSSYSIVLPIPVLNYLKEDNSVGKKGRTLDGKNRLWVLMDIIQQIMLAEVQGMDPVVMFKDILIQCQWSRATLTKFLEAMQQGGVITIDEKNTFKPIRLVDGIVVNSRDNLPNGQSIVQTDSKHLNPSKILSTENLDEKGNAGAASETNGISPENDQTSLART